MWTRPGRPRIIRKDWAQWCGEEPFYRFASLGHMYSAASNYIFGHWRHAGKTMGLAAYGDARGFPRRIIDLQPEGRIEIDTTWVYDLPLVPLFRPSRTLPTLRWQRGFRQNSKRPFCTSCGTWSRRAPAVWRSAVASGSTASLRSHRPRDRRRRLLRHPRSRRRRRRDRRSVARACAHHGIWRSSVEAVPRLSRGDLSGGTDRACPHAPRGRR